jgi:hypothetical protein
LSSTGYVAFGATPPTAYGNNVGAWLGFTGGKAKLSLYNNSNNYFQWDGDKLLIKAANFTLDASGNMTATAGAIGGWTITSNSIQTGNYNTSGTRYLGSSGLSVSNTFRVDSSGNLTATNATITGAITASSGDISGVLTIGGDNNVKIDGTNDRIIISDGTNDRILIGNI